MTTKDEALTEELAKLGPEPTEDSTPAQDSAPAEPRRRRTRKKAEPGAEKISAPRKPRTRAKKPDIAGGMANLYTMTGLAVSAVPSGPSALGQGSVTGTVGLAMVANAQGIGEAWEKAAAEDPRIREALERLLTVSVIGQVIAAHLPIILAALMATGAAPASLGAMMTGATAEA